MAIYEYDLPGVPESAPRYVDTHTIELESTGYLPAKPLKQAYTIGMLAHMNLKWIGYYNSRLFGLVTDASITQVPKVPQSALIVNASAKRKKAGDSFAGAAPIKGIFTGIDDEVAPCR